MESFSHRRIRIENCSVQNTEESVAEDEGQEVVPDELEDGALPHGHELDEALEPLRRVMVPVGVDVAEHPSVPIRSGDEVDFDEISFQPLGDSSRVVIDDFTCPVL